MRAALLATALLIGTPAAAQDAGLPEEVVQTDMEAAMMALNEMGAKLRSLDKFELTVNATTEEVFLDGEKLQFINEVRYSVEKPDKLYASVRSDRKWRKYYYDGKVLTVSAPTSGYYATAGVTGTINEVLDRAYEQYGIAVPLQDLFRWGTDDADLVKPTEAFLVGYAQVGDFATDQYFYRAEGVDFQLWIGRDDDLPHRVVITNTEDPAQPQYAAALEWNTTPTIASGRFTFTPNENSRKIALKPDTDTIDAGSQGGQP